MCPRQRKTSAKTTPRPWTSPAIQQGLVPGLHSHPSRLIRLGAEEIARLKASVVALRLALGRWKDDFPAVPSGPSARPTPTRLGYASLGVRAIPGRHGRAARRYDARWHLETLESWDDLLLTWSSMRTNRDERGSPRPGPRASKHGSQATLGSTFGSIPGWPKILRARHVAVSQI